MALVLAAGLGAGLVPPSALAQPPKAERPVYTVGEKWIRSDGVYDLIRIEGGRYVFAAEGGHEVHLTTDLAIAKVVRAGVTELEFDNPAKIIWPLQVGTWGVVSGRWRSTASGVHPGLQPSTIVRTTWRVDNYEPVQSAAGTFGAFRIVHAIDDARFTYKFSSEFRIWYAPELRRIVKAEGAPGLQMVNFILVAADRTVPAPLQVALTGPESDARLAVDTLTVTGSATASQGVARVTVSVNGVPSSAHDDSKAAKKDIAFRLPVKLREGRNVLVITAVDGAKTTQQEARVVYFEKPPPAPFLPAPVPPAPAIEQQTPAVGGPSSPPKPVPAPPSVVAAPPPAVTAPHPVPPTVALPPSPTPPPVAPASTSAGVATPVPSVVAPPPAVSAPTGVVVPPPTVGAASSPPPPVVGPLPFRVQITAPVDRTTVDQESIVVAGFAAGGKGVSRVLVTVNGSEVSRLEERTPQRSLPINFLAKLREGVNTLVVTAIDADGGPYQEVRTVEYAKTVPLTIAFRYPNDGLDLHEPTTVVAATITSSKGIEKVNVSVNGVDVAPPQATAGRRDVTVAARPDGTRAETRARQKSITLTLPITLREGTNLLLVSAAEPDGTARQVLHTVTYTRPVVAKAPAPPPPIVPNRWAVVIGVGQYESANIAKLKYTVNDAEALYRVLTGSGGFKKEHVLLLTDKTEKKPSLRNIKWALGTFLARSAKKDDTVLIFFAGHGAPEIDQRGLERDGLAKYLVPSDADAEDLYATALPMDEMQNVFARIEAERLVVFLDACYSGAAGGRTFSAKSTRTGNLDELFLERLTRSKGRAIITASRPTEVSVELAELGHGIFTYYLVEGLKGAADLNRDGIVSLQELYEYVEQQVTRKSRSVGGNQHPIMKGELEGMLPLVKVGRR